MVRLVVFITPLFDILCSQITSLVFAEPVLLGPENFLTSPQGLLQQRDTLETFNIGRCSSTQHWLKKTEGIIWGDDGSITTHSLSFPPVKYFPGPLTRVCDAVVHSSTNNMYNLTPPSTDPLHITLPPTSINII